MTCWVAVQRYIDCVDVVRLVTLILTDESEKVGTKQIKTGPSTFLSGENLVFEIFGYSTRH